MTTYWNCTVYHDDRALIQGIQSHPTTDTLLTPFKIGPADYLLLWHS